MEIILIRRSVGVSDYGLLHRALCNYGAQYTTQWMRVYWKPLQVFISICVISELCVNIMGHINMLARMACRSCISIDWITLTNRHFFVCVVGSFFIAIVSKYWFNGLLGWVSQLHMTQPKMQEWNGVDNSNQHTTRNENVRHANDTVADDARHALSVVSSAYNCSHKRHIKLWM